MMINETRIETLNEKFGVDGVVTFEAGPGGLGLVKITNEYAEAEVVLQGAHVLKYRPAGGEDVLWVSEASRFESGKAIRGGIPICWPWFADHPERENLPAHGFLRDRMWEVVGVEQREDGRTVVVLEVKSNEETRALWDYKFRVEARITVGRALKVSLKAFNLGDEAFEAGAALHSYFTVSDVKGIKVRGLEGVTYIDKVDGMKRKVQEGVIEIERETDLIFVGTEDACEVHDERMGRKIVVEKAGSASTVVWNPWVEKAKRMGDFGDEEYVGMVCVETTNAGDDVRRIEPGESHEIVAVIHTERLEN